VVVPLVILLKVYLPIIFLLHLGEFVGLALFLLDRSDLGFPSWGFYVILAHLALRVRLGLLVTGILKFHQDSRSVFQMSVDHAVFFPTVVRAPVPREYRVGEKVLPGNSFLWIFYQDRAQQVLALLRDLVQVHWKFDPVSIASLNFPQYLWDTIAHVRVLPKQNLIVANPDGPQVAFVVISETLYDFRGHVQRCPQRCLVHAFALGREA
jgi:hypothetical protein